MTDRTHSDGRGYEFVGGYPTAETAQRAHDEAGFNRAVQAYRFFYPSVSIMATWKGNMRAGTVANKVFALLEGTPQQYVFTPNSDTPYSGLPLDLTDGPMVLDLPPGPLMSTANDLNQRWIIDMGLPGPDKGEGGRHVILPPGYDGEVPAGYYTGRSTTNRLLVLLRALPRGKDMAGAIELMKSVKVYRLGEEPVAPDWVDLTMLADEDFTPVPWEDNLKSGRSWLSCSTTSPRSRSSVRTTAICPSWASLATSRSSRTSGCGTS